MNRTPPGAEGKDERDRGRKPLNEKSRGARKVETGYRFYFSSYLVYHPVIHILLGRLSERQ
jgi:hypothetical protein